MKDTTQQPKIAIRVENKREFEAVVCKMVENGWGDSPSLKMRYDKRWPIITYHQGFYNGVDQQPHVFPDYTILTFQEFALISGVKVENEKPKEIEILLDKDGNRAIVKSYEVELWRKHCIVYALSEKDIQDIQKAIDGLNGF